MDNEELQAMNVPTYKRNQAAQAIARQFGFDPSDESFAKCAGAILEAWRVDSSLGDRSGARYWIVEWRFPATLDRPASMWEAVDRPPFRRLDHAEGYPRRTYYEYRIVELVESRTVTPGSGA